MDMFKAFAKDNVLEVVPETDYFQKFTGSFWHVLYLTVSGACSVLYLTVSGACGVLNMAVS